MPQVSPIPEGLRTLTPSLSLRNCAKAIEWYKAAFGAEVRGVCEGPGGMVMHAEIKIGDSVLCCADEFPKWGYSSPETLKGTTSSVMVYVEKCDDVFNRAVAAGAKVERPLSNEFWGDRMGTITDPFGHRWNIGTRIENVTPEQLKTRMEAWLKDNPCTA